MSKPTCTWENTSASMKRTRTKRFSEVSWQAGRHTPNTGISSKGVLTSKATLPSVWRDRWITHVCCQLWHNGRETLTLTKQTNNKLAAAHTKMERSMLDITYKDRKTNIWVRERAKVICIINTIRQMKWSWAGHINRLKDVRWTSRVTTWRPYDKKRRQGRPAKRWRDGRGQKSYIYNQHSKKHKMVLCRAYQPPQRRPMDLACYHLETIWHEKTTRETSQAMERRPGQLLERHDMAEDSTIQGNLETACWGLRPTTDTTAAQWWWWSHVDIIVLWIRCIQ